MPYIVIIKYKYSNITAIFMKEIDRMRTGQLTNMSDPEILESFKHAKVLISKMRNMNIFDDNYRELLEELIPTIPPSTTIISPFYCDHGTGIRLGSNVFINTNCTFLDGGYITIGNNTLIGPNVQIYTPHHPLDYKVRRENREYSYPVTIGSDCWIGGGAIICPGVTIGDNTVIGAGSVVTKDIPSGVVAVGNPCKVLREINEHDYEFYYKDKKIPEEMVCLMQ